MRRAYRRAGSVVLLLAMGGGCGQDEAAVPAGCDRPVVALAQETPGQEGRPRVVVVSGDDAAPDVRVVSDDWVATAPAVSPDGTWLVMTRADGDYESAGPGATTLWRAAVDGSGPRRVSSGPDEAAPDVSPDGEEVALVARLGDPSDPTWRVASVPADGGEPRALTPSTGGPVHATAWSPDGERVAYLGEPAPGADVGARGVWVVAGEGGEPQRVTDVAQAPWLDWRDDDTLLVGTTSAEDGTIEQVDAGTGAVERLADDATMPAVTPDGRRLYHLVRVPGPSDGVAGESVEWRLAVGRLSDTGIEDRTFVGDLVIPFLYPYLGLSVGCA